MADPWLDLRLSSCSAATPSSPIESTTSATSVSTSVKPFNRRLREFSSTVMASFLWAIDELPVDGTGGGDRDAAHVHAGAPAPREIDVHGVGAHPGRQVLNESAAVRVEHHVRTRRLPRLQGDVVRIHR